MRSALFYRLLAKALNLTIWRGQLLGQQNLPVSGPGVYLANHAGTLGPIAVAASIPTRLYPWVVADILDSQRAGPYLKKDFVEPQLGLSGWMSTPVAGLLSVVAVHLLRGIECIPASTDKRLLQTYRLSGEYLEHGKSILVFPEDPALPADEECGIRPFKCGFARLGQIFFARTRQNLQFCPVAVHARLRKVQLGKGIVFNPPDAASKEHLRIARLLESTLRRMVAAQLHPLRRSLPVAR